ncbi:tail fiber domain-containing protein [bacterium]|nr:tail fiber domain-containing protein [Candidatus Elulimicrobium humile]
MGWSAVSDVRDKCIFGPVPHGKGFLTNINPISYSFKNRETGEITDNRKRYGFSAQEILALEGENPVLVAVDDPEKLGLTNDYLVPILVNAIKEMSNEIDTLKSRLEALENRIT